MHFHGGEGKVQAQVDAAHAQMRAKQAAAAAADPTLTAPFEGVTIENWAAAAAMMANTPDPNAQMQKLAGLGMDRSLYERANNEFQARMQRDQTMVIATIFGNAFAASQNVQNTGPEPISFEKYGELAGAQAAWGELGMDVNQKLQEVFGITAVDVSNYGFYWSNRFAQDVQLAMKHGDLLEQYKARYMAGGSEDDDIRRHCPVFWRRRALAFRRGGSRRIRSQGHCGGRIQQSAEPLWLGPGKLAPEGGSLLAQILRNLRAVASGTRPDRRGKRVRQMLHLRHNVE